MRYPRPTQRPERFALSPHAPLAQSLILAGLGSQPGTSQYRDSSTTGSHGTYNGNPRTAWGWSPTWSRPALAGNGTAGCVRVAGAANTAAHAPGFSVVWNGNVGAMGVSFAYFVGQDNDNSGGSASNWSLGISDATAHRLRFTLNAGGFADSLSFGASLPTLTPNADYSLAATYDGAVVRLYTNGVPAYSWARTGTIATGSEIDLFADALGTARGSVATVYDCLLWSRALGADEVAALADPSNVDLRVGGVPLILPARRSWPAFTPNTTSGWIRRLICCGE